MNDFSSENRASAWWSTDCRRDVNGETVELILEKQGKRTRNPVESLPERQQEAMRMGLFMQPHIARLFEDKHKLRVKEFDVSLTHSSETWMKSHFDYITEDQRALVECKNYNHAAQRTSLVRTVNLFVFLRQIWCSASTRPALRASAPFI